MLDTNFAIISKERPSHNKVQVMELIGDVSGKIAIISDDMIDTAGTLCAGAQAVKDAGATRIVACATHPLFSGDALERIEASALDEVVVCDTVPLSREVLESSKVKVLPVDRILAQTIAEIFHHGSVSQIFGGENQLF
jgi:ribose-phosphate pyrophosphokinase